MGLAEGEGIFGHGKEKDWQMSMVMGYVVNVGMYFIKKISYFKILLDLDCIWFLFYRGM